MDSSEEENWYKTDTPLSPGGPGGLTVSVAGDQVLLTSYEIWPIHPRSLALQIPDLRNEKKT